MVQNRNRHWTREDDIRFRELLGLKPSRAGAATPTPSSTAWSTTPTGSISTARACGEPVSPAERPEPVALWTCRYAWTTRSVAHMPTAVQQKTSPSSRDSRLTTRLRRCQKPDGQNARAPGDIKSEWWARSSRNPGRDQIGTPGRDHRNQHDATPLGGVLPCSMTD
jgi:hypothetical protein